RPFVHRSYRRAGRDCLQVLDAGPGDERPPRRSRDRAAGRRQDDRTRLFGRQDLARRRTRRRQPRDLSLRHRRREDRRPLHGDGEVSGAAKARRRIATVTLVVAAYDEAIAWFTGKLGFELEE